ncbi:unnamed protein product, partial [Choristocarpus tenellus]
EPWKESTNDASTSAMGLPDARDVNLPVAQNSNITPPILRPTSTLLTQSSLFHSRPPGVPPPHRSENPPKSQPHKENTVENPGVGTDLEKAHKKNMTAAAEG